MKTVLLSTAYLPPISYFSCLLHAERIIWEKHEHYVKQSYRNRALIYGANGLHPLIIPVRHDGGERKPICEKEISYDDDWQKIHWRTITSSYRNSPYFEYFEDEFKSFYETKTETLFEFNFQLLKKILELLQIPFVLEFTSSYEATYPAEVKDLRNSFTPSERNVGFPKYNQVFCDRYGFIHDLSIVDLLFNKGMEAKKYLSEI